MLAVTTVVCKWCMLILCRKGSSRMASKAAIRHAAIIARLEKLLETTDWPLRLPEICKIVEASERTLRLCCHERFGMGPIRYLWMRRMLPAHEALTEAGPRTETVTKIATRFGFPELGRFSVDYRRLFGEAPSATLRRSPPIASYQNPTDDTRDVVLARSGAAVVSSAGSAKEPSLG
jgi:transcriptional regulator GlxA family with amidase domain